MTLTKQMTREEAEELLYQEARLLDERRLEEWLELFTSDGVYWLPGREDSDPQRDVSVIFDDTLQRNMRVYQIVHQKRYAQTPPSRTIHFITNVGVDAEATDKEAVVRCNLLVQELRPGDHQELQVGLGGQRSLAGQCEYRLRNEEGRWLIAMKKVLLIDRDLPVYNLTFII